MDDEELEKINKIQPKNRLVNITTIDNPYNPFEDFTSWFMFDIEKGYYTSSKLARLTNLEDNMTEIEENIEIERAIDRLIEIDPSNMYKKIEKYE